MIFSKNDGAYEALLSRIKKLEERIKQLESSNQYDDEYGYFDRMSYEEKKNMSIMEISEIFNAKNSHC